jgi:glycosyltransferase involved in cell wall biosynthesis
VSSAAKTTSNVSSPGDKPCVHFFANGVFGDAIAGGDIHFFRMAEALLQAGYRLNFFGGYALRRRVEQTVPGARFTLTDLRRQKPFNAAAFHGQVTLFLDYFQRFLGTFRNLRSIDPADIVYAASDYWFDVLPAVVSRARSKMMVLHMDAPSLRQILARSRPDIDSVRLASLHYWMSQRLSVCAFRLCRNKRLLYVHPNMRRRLLHLGYRAEELKYASFGVDLPTLKNTPKQYDVVWIGRVHRQKGVADLLATLAYLASRLSGFHAVLIGNLQHDLQKDIDRLGLTSAVRFAGFVSEEDKFRLFRESRVFLMPSRFEGSPRVIAESLVCNVPVVAYDVPTYRPLFHSFVRYVPCFDAQKFQETAEDQIMEMRNGINYLDKLDLDQFRAENSWKTVQQMFCDTVRALQLRSRPQPS